MQKIIKKIIFKKDGTAESADCLGKIYKLCERRGSENQRKV